MSFHLINPWMLIGLAGIALPVLAHLLSRKKYDVVQWGAMQFLELGRRTRRRIRLEQLLLLLLRMGLIALLAIALSRPWAQGGFLTQFASTQSRDVVFVVDGSYSMGWEGKAVTPHAAAVQWIHRFLEDLRPGDTVALIDARDVVRPVIETPTHDFGLLREKLNGFPEPSGASNLAEAISRAAGILSRTSNLSREIVVLTDGQARCWHAQDANLWARIADLMKQPSITPRVWAIDLSQYDPQQRTNFSVERLRLSRELTVSGFPVRIQTTVHYSGGMAAVHRRVRLEVDGQPLADKHLQISLQPGGEASVEFEYRFPSLGSHVIGVVLDADNLPGDDRAEAAVTVTDALPVLLVDGDPQLDPVRSETHFARAALTPKSNPAPWVRARVVPADRFAPADLAGVAVVVLANVPTLTDTQAAALRKYVAAGGGLFIAPGDRVDAAAYNKQFLNNGGGLLPAKLIADTKGGAEGFMGTHVLNSSLQLPWITRFQLKQNGGFTLARFTLWWKLQLLSDSDRSMKTTGKRNDKNAAKPPPKPTTTKQPRTNRPTGEQADSPLARAAIVAARLDTGDPCLVTRGYGRGQVLLTAFPLDADGNTLPAKPDYVSFLHEMLFHLATARSIRNVDVGTPLVLPIDSNFPIARFAFFGPDGTEHQPDVTGGERHRFAELLDTRLPGVYTFRRTDDDGHKPAGTTTAKTKKQSAGKGQSGLPTNGKQAGDSRPEFFVVNFDRAEADLTPLDAASKGLLSKQGSVEFAENASDLKQKMFADTSKSEMWRLLLLLFLGLLIFETVMTRRLVRGGRTAIDNDELGQSKAPSSGGVQ